MPTGEDAAGRLEKALSRTANMYDDGESDGRIIPAKCPNKGEQAPTEGMEGRRPAKENIGQATPPRTQSRTSELSGLRAVREVARRDKRARFTALLHHVTPQLLRDSYHALKRRRRPESTVSPGRSQLARVADLGQAKETARQPRQRATTSRPPDIPCCGEFLIRRIVPIRFHCLSVQ